MTSGTVFLTHFRAVAVNCRHLPDASPGFVIDRRRDFVEGCRNGYGSSLFEYWDEISVRAPHQEVVDDPEIKEIPESAWFDAPRHDANHADAWKWAERSKFEDWVTQDHVRNWAKLAMRKPMDNMNLGTGVAHRHVLDIKSRHPSGHDADGNDLHSVAVWVKDGEVESVHAY